MLGSPKLLQVPGRFDFVFICKGEIVSVPCPEIFHLSLTFQEAIRIGIV